MQIPRCRNILRLKDHLSQSSLLIRTQFSWFHSTPTYYEKRKNNWNFDFQSGQQPSKNQIKFVTRQKRADAKKALKDLLYHNGSSTISFQEEEQIWKSKRTSNWDAKHDEHADSSDKKEKNSSRRTGKAYYKRLKRKLRKEQFSSEEFDDRHETVFQAIYGNRSFTWSFRPRTDSTFTSNQAGFDWRESKNWANTKKKEWETTSGNESEDERFVVGSFSDRTILGLPVRGLLKIEDVKNAFRSSAFKWHPDKHQGPSQAAAEEKFKLCVNAYNSLCTALSAV